MKFFGLNKILKIALVAIVYFVAAKFSLILQLGNTNATPVWPPSGIAFAAVLVFGAEMWPGISIGAFAVNLLVFYQNGMTDVGTLITSSFFISIGNTLETLSGYYLLKYFNAFDITDKAKDFAFFLASALLMCAVSATIGNATLLFNKIITWQSYVTVWFTWWMGDVSGIIVLTPVLLSWRNIRKTRNINAANTRLIILLFLVLVLYLAAVFGNWLPLGLNKAKTYFVFFILIWCAFRMNQWQSSLVVLFLSVYTIWGTLNQRGPFIEHSQNDSFLSMQVFLCIASVTMMFFSTTLQQRRHVEQDLKEANLDLEQKIQQRTQAIEAQKERLRQTNEELVKKTTELEKANKDARFFSHIISHDLREPLRTITSFIELLEERYKGKIDTDADEYIDFIVGGAKRMHALIDDMLIYSRLEHDKDNFQKIDCNEVIAVVKDNLRNRIKENNATITIAGELPLITADFSQMLQLFQNLIDNAIKYKGTSLPEIIVDARKRDGSWLFSIKDNGIGIPKEYLERIFVIFQRLHTRDKYDGTGVGLAICRKIIDRHGGKIWAETNTNQSGTAFYFTIPIV